MPAERLEMNPRYAKRFALAGLNSAQAFFKLPGDVVSGHPDRHVVRVALNLGSRRVIGFLKREHRIPRRDRPLNALAGFGWVSKSIRESVVIRELADAGVAVPKMLAVGENGQGQAFLLVRSIPGATNLHSFLSQHRHTPSTKRLQLARRIATLIRQVHDLGFDLPDLCAKHLLIQQRTGKPFLIDLPRSRKRQSLPEAIRTRDLARLESSIHDTLVSRREKLAFLKYYLGGTGRLRSWVPSIERTARKYLRHRMITINSVPERRQRLRWLDEERLVVTDRFWKQYGTNPPDWLSLASRTQVTLPRQTTIHCRGRMYLLCQSPDAGWWKRMTSVMAGKCVPSQDALLAGRHFRLERFRVPVPRLMAFGRKTDGSGFILTQVIRDVIPLATWLHRPHPRRLAILHEAGQVLRRIHAAGLQVDGFMFTIHVQGVRSRWPRVVIPQVAALARLPRSAGRYPLQDLGRLVQLYDLTDREGMNFIRGYMGSHAPAREYRELLHTLRAGLPPREELAA